MVGGIGDIAAGAHDMTKAVGEKLGIKNNEDALI